MAETCAFLPVILHDTYWKLPGDCTSTIESEASFIAEHRFNHKHHQDEWCVFQERQGLYYIFYLTTVFGSFSSHCVFTRASSVWKEIDPFRLHVSGVLRSENVYSCTQCWHLKSGKMGYHGSGVYALIVFFSPSFIGHGPRGPSFLPTGCLQKADGQATGILCFIAWCNTNTPSYLLVQPT